MDGLEAGRSQCSPPPAQHTTQASPASEAATARRETLARPASAVAHSPNARFPTGAPNPRHHNTSPQNNQKHPAEYNLFFALSNL